MLDPIADKLLISATLVSLVQLDLAPAWMVAVIIGREFAVTGLRSLAFSRGLVMPASPLGKLKMVSQVVAVLLLLLGWERFPLLLGLGRRRCGWCWRPRSARPWTTSGASAAPSSRWRAPTDFAAAQARRERAKADRSRRGVDAAATARRVAGACVPTQSPA